MVRPEKSIEGHKFESEGGRQDPREFIEQKQEREITDEENRKHTKGELENEMAGQIKKRDRQRNRERKT